MPDGLLLCVPTRFELDRLRALAPDSVATGRAGPWAQLGVIGFGPVAAAASVAQLIALHQPAHVVLVGIAGTYGESSEVGTAKVYGSVRMDGIGAGEGHAFLGPRAMGFPQWDGWREDQPGSCPENSSPNQSKGPDSIEAIFDRCSLADEGPELLTVAAAAVGVDMIHARRARHPEASAEDMESFGAALSATMAGLPLTVIRGLSNVAGDRNPKNWSIDAALVAAANKLRQWVESR